MQTRAIHDAVVLTDAPQKIRGANPLLIGTLMQNNHATANIYLRSGGDGLAGSYVRLEPSGDLMQDILPPQEELWAYSDTAGAVLTLVEKYRA